MINFIKNYHILREKIFFSKKDILDLWLKEKDFNLLIKEWIIRYLFNDLYTLSEKEVDISSEISLLIPQTLDKKNYITSNTALFYHWLIYWWIWVIIWSAKNEYEIRWRDFYIKTIKTPNKKADIEDFFIDVSNNGVTNYINKIKINLASKEQAIVDRFYFNSIKYWLIHDCFDEENFFIPYELKEKINIEKLNKIAKETMDEKTIQSVNNLINWFTTQNYVK